jgi:hypothetical protein
MWGTSAFNWPVMQWVGEEIQDEPWNHLKTTLKGLYHQRCQDAHLLSLWRDEEEEDYEREATRRYSDPIAEHPW